MKILIVVENRPRQWFLVGINNRALIKEVRGLVSEKLNELAIMTAFSKGSLVKIVDRHNLSTIEADLILSKDNASWDIVK